MILTYKASARRSSRCYEITLALVRGFRADLNHRAPIQLPENVVIDGSPAAIGLISMYWGHMA